MIKIFCLIFLVLVEIPSIVIIITDLVPLLRRKDMKIVEIDKSVADLVKQNNGYCPCAIVKNEDTKCMCKEFREQVTGDCHCGRFRKVKDDE